MIGALTAGLRNLLRARGFSALVVVTLALGIGATTAMFSVVDAVLIRPLPFPHADRINEIWTYFDEGAARMPGSTSAVISSVRQQRELFELVAAYQFGSGTLTGGAEPVMLSFASLSPDAFAIFPTVPVIGRLFTAADATAAESVILISEGLWSKYFGRDPGVLDRVVMIDDAPQRIIGVLPRRFRFPEDADAWRPVDVTSSNARTRVQLVVLRRPDVTAEQINDRLKALTAGLHEAGSLPRGQYLVSDFPVQVRVGRDSARPFYLLFGAVAILLLVACVNVSNLMLVRASSRAGELALMAAIGAGRARLLRDAATENGILAALGGGLGLWLASGLLDLILAVTPAQMRLLNRVTGDLDWRAVVFAVAVTAATCLTFGMLPAWRASRVDPIDALKRQSRSTAGRREEWWQGALVSAQVALVVVLLAGAGLLLRSFVKLNQVDLGFKTEGVALISLQLTAPRYTTPGAAVRFMQDFERRAEAALGVNAAISTSTPSRFAFVFDVQPEAEGMTPPAESLWFGSSRVSPDFFDVFGIPLIAGRTFDATDGINAIVVSETTAQRFWGTMSPIGRRFRFDRNVPWATVVGVARDVKGRGPNEGPDGGMEFYRPLDIAGRSNSMTLAVPVSGAVAPVTRRLKEVLWEADPRMPVLAVEEVGDTVRAAVGRERFVLSLSGAFTIAALVIAAVGVYGVSAFWVARRRRELAIRLAIGATPRAVARSVIGRSIRLAAIGAVLGLTIALSGARVIASMLFATDPRDPLTFAAITVLLTVIAIVAVLAPAIKASRVDPMATLRAE